MNPTPTDIPTPITDAVQKAYAEYCNKVAEFVRQHEDLRDWTSEQLEKEVGKCPHDEYETARTLERENVTLREELERHKACRNNNADDRDKALNERDEARQQRDELKAEVELARKLAIGDVEFYLKQSNTIAELKSEVERLKKELLFYTGDAGRRVEGLKAMAEGLSIPNTATYSDFKAVCISFADQISLLEKTICELREALKSAELELSKFVITSVGLAYARQALSLTPSEISEKWVRFDEQLAVAILSVHYTQKFLESPSGTPIITKALTLARTELGKGEK